MGRRPGLRLLGMVVSGFDTLRLTLAEEKLEQLKDIIQAGLNAGCGDGEWEALVDAGELLGLEYDEEEDRYA